MSAVHTRDRGYIPTALPASLSTGALCMQRDAGNLWTVTMASAADVALVVSSGVQASPGPSLESVVRERMSVLKFCFWRVARDDTSHEFATGFVPLAA